MLCINLTSVRDNKPIYLNNKLTTSRLYVGTADTPSFPNRLVFNLNEEQFRMISEELQGLDESWLRNEIVRIGRGPIIAVIPFALRVQEEAYTSFHERIDARPMQGAINLDAGEPAIFMHGRNLPSICAACERQAQLKGRRCPDYQEGNFACFKSSRFALTAMDTFYMDEKGGLFYNATSVSESDGEQVESNTGEGAGNTEE